MKEEQGKKTGPPPKTKVSQKLSDLVTYCKTAGFKGFEEAKTKGKADYMSSFAEGKAVKLATNNRDDYSTLLNFFSFLFFSLLFFFFFN